MKPLGLLGNGRYLVVESVARGGGRLDGLLFLCICHPQKLRRPFGRKGIGLYGLVELWYQLLLSDAGLGTRAAFLRAMVIGVGVDVAVLLMLGLYLGGNGASTLGAFQEAAQGQGVVLFSLPPARGNIRG